MNSNPLKTIEIIPFHWAGEFKLNESRSILMPQISFRLRSSRESTEGVNSFIIDDYEQALAYYSKTNEKLFYVSFAPVPTYELMFENQNLFALNSGAIFRFLKKSDPDLYIEDYVGFGSLKYGIDIYAPNFTDDKSSQVEAISFAIKGYFDSIYKNTELNIDNLQQKLKN